MEAADVVGMADDPAIELLNTVATPYLGEPLDFISDGASYLHWLELTGLIAAGDRVTITKAFDKKSIDNAAAHARDLRERLRSAVSTWSGEDSGSVPKPVVASINDVLSNDSRIPQLRLGADGYGIHDHYQWSSPEQLLVPPMDAWAKLFAEGNNEVVRQCEGCTIWFYDRTKAGHRRWCSMSQCGNREKARRHRAAAAEAKSSAS
jgi:predicted RNA-binding Zn ribbon-like protein